MNIVIVGGGTAGWLASLMLSHFRPQHSYTTIDSQVIGPIGVGEAATGKLNTVLEACGIDIMDFMLETDALPKHALRFINWARLPSQFDSPLEYSTSHRQHLDTNLFYQLLTNQPIENASVSGMYSKIDRTTYKLVDDQLVMTWPHALQFDANRTAEFLKKQAIKRNVTHISDNIINVVVENRSIKELQTQSGRTIQADLFIDCSGLTRLLIGKLDPEIADASPYIHVNSAMLFKLKNDTRPKKTVGVSIARDWGWNFEISTRNRIGSGYVHNSNMVSKQTLLTELEHAYGQSVEEVRTISWKPGSLRTPWVGNTIAVGLSSSFLEPLQTGSIHDTIIQLQDLIETSILETKEQTIQPAIVNSFNARCERLFQDYLDFLCISYAGGREDTEFWKWVKHDQLMTDRAQHLLELAQTRLTRELDFDKFMGYGSQGLYNYTFAGLGLFNKKVIESTLQANNIDLESVAQHQEKFEREQQQKVFQSLTSEQLNNILKIKKESLA